MDSGFIILVIKNLKGSPDFPETYHNIVFTVYIIPIVVFFGLRTDYAVKTRSPLSFVWSDFLDSGDIFTVMYCLVPVIILLIVLIWSFIPLFSEYDGSACNFSGDDV